jgi:AcrR family transcriptional regulator
VPIRTRPTDKGSARERMLDAAEQLLGEHGIEGVSLRQIGAVTGQGNNSAVQYYFGDKAGLVREIIARRVAAFEPRRQELLATATAQDRLADVRTLLEIVFLPLTEITDVDGRHVYIRFMMQFLTRFQHQAGFGHPGWLPDSAATRAVMLLADRLPFLKGEILPNRINRVGGLFFSAVIDRDNAIAQGKPVEPEEGFFADLFAMMAAAIQAPPQA